jgi:glycosyltransferase involved in cell wall biosynthesis
VVPSRFLEEIFGRHGLSAEVLPNYVDLGRFAEVAARSGRPRIVVTRNLEPIYRVHDAVEVFRRVRERWPEAELVIAGEGSERPALERRAREVGLTGLRFLGRVDNARIAEVYQGADVMLNPTGVDNMPVSVLEAFAAGVPVVSTCAGGVPFLVEDGVNGLLADVGDVSGLTALVNRVLGEPSLGAKLASAGRESAAAFALERVTAAWRDLYREECSADCS